MWFKKKNLIKHNKTLRAVNILFSRLIRTFIYILKYVVEPNIKIDICPTKKNLCG